MPAERPCQTPLMTPPSRHVSTEIADQPSAWSRAAQLGPTEDVSHALPERGQRVAIIGCGTSFFMAQSFADLRERSGHGETDAFAASEFPTHRSYDALVALTRSGTTTEVLRLLGTLRNGTGPRTVAITADPNTPVVELADHRVVLGFADEKSIVQTRFATTSLALWRAWLGEDLTAVIEQGRSALTDPLPPRTLEAAQFTFLGTRHVSWHRERGRIETARGVPVVDRVLSGYGIPSWSDQRRRAKLDGLGVRAASPGLAGGPPGDRCACGEQRS